MRQTLATLTRYITRGNLIDLAVAVVIAYGDLINAIVTFLIIAAVQVLHGRAGFSYRGIALTTL